ncbi:S-layer homology domain-containing protein [Paenibacillus sp. LHD-117]|uniref:S-layer homology domain-containing protein n=1 Tax=Paenibacillus sp. LHD-117 TaxID=3071412 RepID=UPI0027DF0BA7|nr:S-layer homology domain-containing protein [Paenibacillus sp. LHD-117]MDQ6418454.1 S-layer homology domain-containing protein [Paenibacillus sp. LHD-117]
MTTIIKSKKAKQGIGKRSMLSLLLLIVCVSTFAVPVQAAGAWSQYAKISLVASSNLGGFNGPTGVAVDSSGNVYVADTYNHRIQKLTNSTGIWSEWGAKEEGSGIPGIPASGSGLGEFNNPNGVAVDSNGNLYVSDRNNHRIQKLTVSTGVWSEWGAKEEDSGNPGIPATGSGLGQFYYPGGVAVDSSGNVYVADSYNNRIQKLTVSPIPGIPDAWSSLGSGTGSGLGQFNNPSAVAVDGSGNVYVADMNNHRIQKQTVTGEWSDWGKKGGNDLPISGNGLGEFSYPAGVAVDSSGNVYVADWYNTRIQKRTVTGEWSDLGKKDSNDFPIFGNEFGEFNYPTGVAVDSGGNVYVADQANHRIQKLTVSIGDWSQWGYIGPTYGSVPGEFYKPNGVAIDSSGNVYVADNYSIQKLTVSTGAWDEWRGDSENAILGEFDHPSGVAVDSSGNMYVADTNYNRIQKLTASSGVWSQWRKNGGGSGSALGEFDYPSGLAVDSSGNVYVADTDNHRIQKLTVSTGVWSEWVKSGGGPGSDLGEFNYPSGVAVDSSGNVYVADTENHRIQKLTVSTGVWSEWGKSGGEAGSSLGEFDYPSGVAVDSSGNVYVADTENHRIQKLTVSTGVWSEWRKSGGGSGSGLGEFDYPSGVAVDSSGNVYVADNKNHRIQKLSMPGSPTGVMAAAGNGQATISFTAPVSDGGSAITGYTVTASPGDITESGTTSPITITGLTNGTVYTFTVVATNGLGNSSVPSSSVSVTPNTPSGSGSGGGGLTAPTSPVTSTDGKLTLPTGKTGEVSLGDEVTITVPVGATDQELKLTIEKVLETAPLLTNNDVLASPVFEILKNFSENFSKPVTLTFAFDPSKLSGNQTVAVFYYDETKKEWVEVPGGVVSGDQITVDVNHFTKYAVFAVGQGATVNLSDISGHWSEANIKQAVSNGIVSGYPEGTFKPEKTVTRAEFAVMLMNALKPKGEEAALTFTDTAEIEAWAQKAVAQAVQAGWITGYEDGTFRPDAEITRAEMTAMIAKALGHSAGGGAATGFADDNDIPAWAKASVAYVKQAGIVQGKGSNTFAPSGHATRAEAVTVLLNMLAHLSK